MFKTKTTLFYSVFFIFLWLLQSRTYAIEPQELTTTPPKPYQTVVERFTPDPIEIFPRTYPDKVITLTPDSFSSSLEPIISYAIYLNNNTQSTLYRANQIHCPRIEVLTPEEARSLLTPLVKESLEQKGILLTQQGDLINKIFDTHFFGKDLTPPAPTHTSYLFHPCFQMPQNIYTTAKRILKNTHQGDVLVAFGNSPALIHRAFTHMVSEDPADPTYRQLVSFPFSGSPNRTRIGSLPTFNDAVTSERLAHLQKRMAAAGLTPDNPNMVNHTTYFIDIIGSGSGLAYIMDEIITAFQAKELTPKIATISMNEININEKDVRNSLIAKASATDGQKTRLYFPSKSSPCFAVDNFVVYLQNHGLLDMIPSSWRILPESNPAFWNAFYDKFLFGQPHPEHIKILLRYFDVIMEELKKADKQRSNNHSLEKIGGFP